MKDLTGNRYGRLVVLHQGERTGTQIGWSDEKAVLTPSLRKRG